MRQCFQRRFRIFHARCNVRSTSGALVVYGLTLALLGCSARAARTPVVRPAAGTPRPAGATETSLPTTIITPTSTTDVEELFEAGQTHLRQGNPSAAAKAFEAVLQHDPRGPLAERALSRAALAYEATGELEVAAQRFEELGRRFPEGSLASEALVRAMRVRLHRAEWALAERAASAFLARYKDAPALWRIVAYSARGLGALERGQGEEADYAIAKGLEIVDALELDRAGRVPRDVAQLYFALGEARRARAEAVRLGSDVAEFPARLEQRCAQLLAAQSAYSDVMRAYDAHWSTIAGYRVAELYERLHTELMAIPMPRSGTERDRQLFEGAMRLRYSVLLTKAASMLEHTLAMVERTGTASPWVDRARDAQESLARAVAAEERAIDQLPFTREDLQRALDDLAARAASTTRPAPRPADVQ